MQLVETALGLGAVPWRPQPPSVAGVRARPPSWWCSFTPGLCPIHTPGKFAQRPRPHHDGHNEGQVKGGPARPTVSAGSPGPG